MKKILLIICCISVTFSKIVAQIAVDNKINSLPVTKTGIVNFTNDPSRGTQCTQDTLLYSYLKEIYKQAPTFKLDPFVGPNRAWSQAFELNGPITIDGIQFWGNVQDAVNASQTITAKAYLYTVNASNKPVSKIDSATVVVGTNQTLYTALFNTPVTINSDFAVVIQNPSATDTLGVIVNNATAATYGEGLGWRRFGTGVWNTATTYWGQDAEPVIAPIIRYSVVANYTVTSNTTVCLGSPMTFTDASSPIEVIGHRMYNYRVFESHWGSASDSTYTWDMGDGNNKFTRNTSHQYVTPGTYNCNLTVMGGLYKRCLDYKAETIEIIDTAKANFSMNTGSSPTIQFTNTSTGAVSYSWDFGDGSPAGTAVSPSHTYTAAGTYTVTLAATSAMNCNVNKKQQLVNIVSVDIADISREEKIIYSHFQKMLMVDLGNYSTDAQIEILNIIGKVVYSQRFFSNSLSVDLSGFNSGIYIVRISANGKSKIKKITVK